MTKDMQSINQVTDEQLFEMYENHPDEGTRMTAFLEMARRIDMVSVYMATACAGIRRHTYMMKVGIVATFQTIKLQRQEQKEA